MIILDTNVLSELMRLSPSDAVVEWFTEQALDEIRTTAVSRAEILYGIEILPAGKRRSEISGAAESVFRVLPEPMLPFDAAAAAAFGKIAASRRKRGRPIDFMDAQIAAIALVYGATLATRDAADFAHCGVRVVNPWRR